MSTSLSYHGNVSTKEANATVQYLKQNYSENHVRWWGFYNVGWGVQLSSKQSELKQDIMKTFDNTAYFIANGSSIRHLFTKRIHSIAEGMYSQRAFVHWYKI